MRNLMRSTRPLTSGTNSLPVDGAKLALVAHDVDVGEAELAVAAAGAGTITRTR
jgi:hypothetical protein